MKRILPTLLLVLLIAGFFGYAAWNKPHRKAENERSVTVSAPALYQAYAQNEASANTRFLNKVLRINGTLLSQERNQDGKLVAVLQATPAGGDELLPAGIMCTMREQGMTLKAGQQVTLKGFCTGYTGDVHLSDCVPAN